MKILFLTGREVRYPLNQMLLHALRQYNQVDVVEENGSGSSILKRSLQVFFKALSYVAKNDYDLIFVGFFGQFLMPAVRMITKKPILFHPLISTYETLIFDRKVATKNSPVAKLSYALDNHACHAANHLILDTQTNVSYFSSLFKIAKDHFSSVFVGSDERIFFPQPGKDGSGPAIIHYHGSFLPLHGIDTIIEAARFLKNDPQIRFQLLGSGLEYKRIYRLVNDFELSNVTFIPSVPLEHLPIHIAKASVCLGGHFGISDKAARVIAGKTFQDIAMGKATIVGDNSANLELLTHGYDAWFCPMNDPQALTDSIVELVKNTPLRETIGENARRTFMEKASLKALTPQIQQVVEQAVCSLTL